MSDKKQRHPGWKGHPGWAGSGREVAASELAAPTGSAAPIYKTLQEASEAHGQCPRQITQDRSHWWYNDWDEIARRERKRDMDAQDSWPCICKTCSLRVNVDPHAHDLPEV